MSIAAAPAPHAQSRATIASSLRTSPLPQSSRTRGPRLSSITLSVFLLLGALVGQRSEAAIAFRAAASANSGTGTATSLAINKPTGVVNGDFMLAGISVSNNDATLTAPSGWTLVRNIDDGLLRFAVYRKMAGSSEPSSYTWTLSTGRRVAGGIVAFSGVNATTPIQAENGVAEGTTATTTHTTPTISTTGSDTWLVSIFGDRGSSSSTWTPPSGATERADVKTTNGSADVSLAINHQGPVAAGNKSHTATASLSRHEAAMEIIALNAAPSAPAAPSGLTASAVSSSQINLTWTDNSSDETGFKIERKTGSGGTYSLIHTTAANATSYNNTGLSAGTTYYYRVSATNGAGDSAYSNEANATTQSESSAIAFRAAASANSGTGTATSLVINKPTGVVNGDFMLGGITVSNNDATLTAPTGWTLVRNINDGLLRFAVYRKMAGSSEPSSYTWTLSTGRRVAGGIVAFSGVNATTPIQIENGQAEGDTATTTHTTPTISTTGSSTWLVSIFGDRGSSSSTWTPPSGATERVDVKTSNGSADVSLAINHQGPVAAGNKSHTATASLSRHEAAMEIIALNAGSGGGGSAPAAPSGLSATAVSSSQINLAWTDNSSDETGFKIERKTGAGGTWSQIHTTGANATSYNNTGLSASTTYYYRVRATNGSGDSTYSNEASATTQSAVPLPYFGRFYGSHIWGQHSTNNRLRESSASGVSLFFYAERSGTVVKFRYNRRVGTGYSDGDGGTYTMSIWPADPVTRAPITTGTPLSQVTGISPGITGNNYPTVTFTSVNQALVAGQPYCFVFRNTHSNPSGNHVSMNWGSIYVFDESNPPFDIAENFRPPVSGIPGISGLMFPYPTVAINGQIAYRTMGNPYLDLLNSDGVWTGNCTIAQDNETENGVINGSQEARDRRRVTRANRVVDGVWIRIVGKQNAAGSLVVRLEDAGTEHGVDTNDLSGNGTLIEEVTVPASSLYIISGNNENTNEVQSSPPYDQAHWVFVPFSQQRTLQVGRIYNLRFRKPSGAGYYAWLSLQRGEHTSAKWTPQDNQGVYIYPNDITTWAQHESTHRLPWHDEDSRGPQISSDGGATWQWWGGNLRKTAPILYRCVP